MKARLLLYKSKLGDGHWIDNLISLWTFSKYSHVEIWTGQLGGLFDVYFGIDNLTKERKYLYRGTCYTSTMRNGGKGTCKRPVSEVLKHPERWDYIEFEVKDPDLMMAYMNGEVKNNKGYSKWDLLKFVSPIHLPDNKRNICSEFCNNALHWAGIIPNYGIVSPGKLYKIMTKLGYETKELT